VNMMLTEQNQKAFKGIPVLVVNRAAYLPDEVVPEFSTVAWKLVEKNMRDFKEMEQWFQARKFVQVGRSRQVSEPERG